MLTALAVISGALPFTALLLFILAFLRVSATGWYEATTDASLLWAILIILETCTLSAAGLLTRAYITIFWIAVNIAGLFAVWKSTPCAQIARFGIRFTPFSLAVGTICGLALLAAFAYPPNYPDSLSYHLPRVMHWLQDESLAPFFTSNLRELGMAPLNAWILLQSIAISESDYFVNLPQWLAFCGCIAGAWHLAAQTELPPQARSFAAFYFCTTPIAIMQAANSENSLIVTYWLSLFFSAFIDWWRRPTSRSTIIIGASLGLALLTKGSAAPIAIPFALCIAWKCLHHFKRLFTMGVIMGVLVIAINFPHLYRTYTTSGRLFLSAEKNIVTKPDAALIAVNGVYNFLLQEPWLVAVFTKKGWSDFAASLDVDDHDEAIFPFGGIEKARSNLAPSDNDGQSPVHTLLILLAATWLLYKRPINLRLYLGLFCASGCCFIALLYWQPWGARLHLPFFLLAAPLIAYATDVLACPLARKTITALLALSAVMPVFFCLEHPLGPPALLAGFRQNIGHFLTSSRDENYFNVWRATRKSYLAAADYLIKNRAASIGLDLGDNGIEYPLWALLKKNINPAPKIFHFDPDHHPEGEKPEYIFRQRLAVFGDLPQPVLLKREANSYRQIFPTPVAPPDCPPSSQD